MKEISANLHRDMKDLLEESANIVTGFFKNGVCTVRGAAARWKAFTQDISDAWVSLFRSPKEATLPDLSPEREPVVTVMESADVNLPVGTYMTLSEAEQQIADLNALNWNSDEPNHPVKVAIDYMMDGQVDRYWLPLTIGPSLGSMLEQMERHVEACLKSPQETTDPFYDAPEDLAKLLHAQFGPQFQTDLEKLAARVMNLFRQHVTITRLEQQFDIQSLAIPATEQEKFLQSTKAVVTDLRRAVNTGKDIGPVQEHTAPVRGDSQNRKSVKVKLREIKNGPSKSPSRPKSRPMPER